MKEDVIIMMVMASIFAIVGISFMASQGFTNFALRTRTGQKWVRWFGERKSSIILRFVVGPFVSLISVVAVWAAMGAK